MSGVSTKTLSTFFALLSLLCAAGTVATVVVALLARRGVALAASVKRAVEPNALWFAWIVAAVTTGGSLYYSLGAHFEPCELCWYQRICVYPLSVVLLIAALRNDYGVWRYTLPVAVIGIMIAAYHSQLQAFPSQETFCSRTNPCTVRYVWQFGFVSLPLMDLAALLFIATMLVFARGAERADRSEPVAP